MGARRMISGTWRAARALQCCSGMNTLTHVVGLGDPELEAFRRLVEASSDQPDAWHRMMGLLTAVASAPSPIVAGDWVKAAHAPLILDQAGQERAWRLTLTFFSELCDWLDEATAVTPPLDDEAAVDAFCRGYVKGISLDHHWRNSPGLLALAMPMVVLGGMRTKDDFGLKLKSGAAERAWTRHARQGLPRHVLEVYEAMRASGREVAMYGSRRRHWL